MLGLSYCTYAYIKNSIYISILELYVILKFRMATSVDDRDSSGNIRVDRSGSLVAAGCKVTMTILRVSIRAEAKSPQ